MYVDPALGVVYVALLVGSVVFMLVVGLSSSGPDDRTVYVSITAMFAVAVCLVALWLASDKPSGYVLVPAKADSYAHVKAGDTALLVHTNKALARGDWVECRRSSNGKTSRYEVTTIHVK